MNQVGNVWLMVRFVAATDRFTPLNRRPDSYGQADPTENLPKRT